MPHVLKEIEIDEISFVTKGASGDGRHAPKIIFLKGKQPMPDKPTFLERLKGYFAKEDGGRTPEQMLEDLKGQLTPEQQDILMLLLAAAKAAPPEAAMSTPTPEPKPDEPEKMGGMGDSEEMKKILKDNPELADHFAKIAEARKADREKLVELEKRNAEQEAKQRLFEFQKQAEQYTWLPGDHDEVAKMWEEVDRKLSPESQETLAGMIRATDGIVQKSSGRLFEERGSSRPANGSGGGTLQKLEDAAVSIQKEYAAKDEKITIERARTIVLQKNRELRREVDRNRQ